MKVLEIKERKNEVKSRWYVEIVDDSMKCGFSAHRKIYLPICSNVNYGKCLKKLWKRCNKIYACIDNISIYAFIESEEDGELHDMSQFWMYEELEYREEAELRR